MLSVEASGASVLALTRTMGGTANLTARQGSISGFNVEQLLKRLEQRPLSVTGDFRRGRTPFDFLNVALRIAQGTASVEDMRLEGGSIRLALGGSSSIPARDLDLKGLPRWSRPATIRCLNCRSWFKGRGMTRSSSP